MKVLSIIAIAALLAGGDEAFAQQKAEEGSGKSISLSQEDLKDKIKGGWAGQTIGVTFGGPTEFRFNGTFIQDYQPIVWYDGYLKKTMEEHPGLYDDIYMDLTFVEVLERAGMDAPVDSFAQAFAYAKYDLWHANQSARYNILNGIKAPESGHWRNNPHADDIDFQIEADFSGLMSPGMPNTAVQTGDKIGHIMNYGDGWYGGAYVGAMYSLAFVSKDVNYIVSEALKVIPAQSTFYRCIADVIRWHKQYPDDWKQTWMEIQKKWSEDTGCPEGVFSAFNIDAKINAAYIVLGLLYGKGDFDKTFQISTRAGQDSDCNPSSAGGILGTMHGYNKIPAYWKMGLKDVEDMPFKYTNMSLNKVYEISYRHALEMIRRNGGTVTERTVEIKPQLPKAVRLEQSFEGMFPVSKTPFSKAAGQSEFSFDFTGTGFVLLGNVAAKKSGSAEYILEADLYIDGKKAETVKFPTTSLTRRNELFWRYELPDKKHSVRVQLKNPHPDYELRTWDYLIYAGKPFDAGTGSR